MSLGVLEREKIAVKIRLILAVKADGALKGPVLVQSVNVSEFDSMGIYAPGIGKIAVFPRIEARYGR